MPRTKSKHLSFLLATAANLSQSHPDHLLREDYVHSSRRGPSSTRAHVQQEQAMSSGLGQVASTGQFPLGSPLLCAGPACAPVGGKSEEFQRGLT